MSGTLNLHFLKGLLAPPQVQTSWSSTGPGGGQVTCLLNALATLKKKGITGNHVVFFFVSRRIQHLQRRKHPVFRYEGVNDRTRFTLEPLTRAEVVRRCYKLLDNFDESLILPSLFWAGNPPEKSWVSIFEYLYE